MAKNTDQTRVRRTYREIFLDSLRALSTDGNVPVTNRALRTELGWDEERYNQVKDQLIREERITIGRGQGGTVGWIQPKRQARARKPSVSTAESARSKRARRTYRGILLDKLTALSNGGKSLVGNGILLDELGWDSGRYWRIKNQLVEEGTLIVGRGHGGSVGLASQPGAKGLTLFVSYSHADEDLKNELMKHLEPLRQLHQIETWHDRKINPGDEWEKTIASNLKKADIILLLISIDFINSKYCYDIELESAMERHASGDAVVVPIVLRNCMWKLAPFAKLQALPKDGKAVCSWPDRDDALTTVAEGIRRIVEDRLASPGLPNMPLQVAGTPQ